VEQKNESSLYVTSEAARDTDDTVKSNTHAYTLTQWHIHNMQSMIKFINSIKSDKLHES